MNPISLVLAFALLSLVSKVTCGSAEDKEMKVAERITSTLCDDDHNDGFYKCFTGCQARNPYGLTKPTECNQEARKALYKEAGLNGKTKKMMCDGMPDYAIELKKIVIGLKGEIKSSCATEPGMTKFFEQKLACFLGCEG